MIEWLLLLFLISSSWCLWHRCFWGLELTTSIRLCPLNGSSVLWLYLIHYLLPLVQVIIVPWAYDWFLGLYAWPRIVFIPLCTHISWRALIILPVLNSTFTMTFSTANYSYIIILSFIISNTCIIINIEIPCPSQSKAFQRQIPPEMVRLQRACHEPSRTRIRKL